jgi:hypothetical protein
MDTPRRLTEEEIERVLEAIPYPNAITRKHSEFARNQILQVIRSDLMAIELAPSGLDELIDRIVNQFEESRVKPGSMVGFAAAEAPSNRFTQDNLSAVHKAGQAGMRGTGGAVARIADLISKQQSKNASDYDACTIFFTDIQTQHSIMHNKRPEMVLVTISALLQVEQPFIIEYHNVIFPDKKLPPWYSVYSQLYGVPMPDLDLRDNGKLLRLRLDIEKVVEYRVMVSELRRALMSANSRVLRFYVSPMHIGIVDIWALDEEFHSYSLDTSGNPELDVFNVLHGFADRLGAITIKGIPGIRDVQAAHFDIWPIMTLGQSSRQLNDNVYEYRLSSIWPMRFGWQRPRQLWQHLGITVQDFDNEEASWVILDGGSKGPPHEIIRNAVNEDEQASKKWEQEAVGANKSIVTRPVTPDQAGYWSKLWYAKTEGTNLREISVRDDVDARYTISNRPFEVLEMYGIVAARRVMLEELYLAFGGGRDEPNFSVRHFSILADFVCHTGVIRQISNLLIQGRSTLSKATFARQFNTLVGPAIHGVDEPIGDVSAAIMVAARAKIGPRAFEYEGGVNQGITAAEIQASLRSGSRSAAEIDKLIASLAETTDTPLYITGGEGDAAMNEERALMGGQDDDAEADAEYIREYEAAALPPGLDDDEEAPPPNLIVDDEDVDEPVSFAQGEDEPKPPTRRRSTAARRRVVMAPALVDAAARMGGTMTPGILRTPPDPVCPIPKRSSRAKKLTFVDDD